jgi:1-acyl-sn-glycerol-3-phosphate acyltransferase
MKIIYLSIRFPLVILHIVIGLIILIFFPSNVYNLKPMHHKISYYWMKVLVKLFGLNIIKYGEIDLSAKSYVSNHVSFFDIIIMNSLIPSNFIAKSEIKNWPIIGHLAAKTGTIFIKRGDASDNDNVINIIKKYISLNKKVFIFPEGRIGDGKNIKKFHSKMFNAICSTDSNSQPVFIRYPINFPSNIESDDSMCWSDKSQTLFNISLRCMCKSSTNVIVYFGNSIKCNKSAYDLAKLTFQEVGDSINNIK